MDATELRNAVLLLHEHSTSFVRRRLAAVLALVAISAIVSAVCPVALRCLIDGLAGRDVGYVDDALPLAGLYVLSLGLARGMTDVRELVFAGARQRILRTVGEAVFSHLMRLPLRFHLRRQTGEIIQTLDNGLEGLRIALHHVLFTIVPVTVELLMVIIVIGHLFTPVFLLLFGGALISYAAAFGRSARSLGVAARRGAEARSGATAAITEGLFTYETVKNLTAEKLVENRVKSALKQAESEWVGFYRIYALNGLVVTGIFSAFLAGMVGYATAEVERARITIGDFVLINAYMLQLLRPIEMMGYALQGLAQGLALLNRLVQLLHEPCEPESSSGVGRLEGPCCLEFRQVSLSYGSGRTALRDVSFRVPVGRTLAVVGPSGSGKTSIVRLMMRLLEPDSGLILLDDVPISSIAPLELRRSIGVVPQEAVLFEGSMQFNISVGRIGASQKEIEAVAAVAQVHEFISALPNGYETLVGQRGLMLSGGERQRFSIARALLKSPRIYVFDEATSSLDSLTERQILCRLKGISRGCTTLVIAHRLSTIVDADEIVVLDRGRVSERGTHAALLRQNGLYAALWTLQQGDSAALPTGS